MMSVNLPNGMEILKTSEYKSPKTYLVKVPRKACYQVGVFGLAGQWKPLAKHIIKSDATDTFYLITVNRHRRFETATAVRTARKYGCRITGPNGAWWKIHFPNGKYRSIQGIAYLPELVKNVVTDFKAGQLDRVMSTSKSETVRTRKTQQYFEKALDAVRDGDFLEDSDGS